MCRLWRCGGFLACANGRRYQGALVVANTKDANKPAKNRAMKKPGGRKPGDKGRLEAHKGAEEKHLLRARRAFDLRCEGRTIRQIAHELKVAPSTVHDDIETFRAKLRAESLDLAVQEREIALQQIDDAISHVIPHIRGDIQIETVKEGKKGPIVITVEAYEARMKGVSALTRLIERKSRMLGMEAAIKVEQPPATPPEENLAAARDVLSRWGVNFAPSGIVGKSMDE